MKACNITLLFIISALSGCLTTQIMPEFYSPGLDTWHDHTIQLSDNTIHISLPSGFGSPRLSVPKSFVDINDDSLYKGKTYYDIGMVAGGWQAGVMEDAQLSMTFFIDRVGMKGIEASANLIQLNDFLYPDPSKRFKESVQFQLEGPSWIRYDFPGKYIYEADEVFIFPLENNYLLRISFGLSDLKRDGNNRQNWRGEAEDIVDQIMANITIDTGAEAATIPYGVPDLGLVKPGTLKYFDDISVR